jgi:cytochrome c-type biogenesis protein CcsB
MIMRKLTEFLFSPALMAIVLSLFAFSIAIASFIENDFGSSVARALVYNSRWFELLLFIGIINLLGTIIRKKLYKRSKLTVFLFHVSFILILTGAAVTRYTGFEGTMAIREGESSNTVLTDKTYIQVRIGDEKESENYIFPASFNVARRSHFKEIIDFNGKRFKLYSISYINNAVPEIRPDDNGISLMELLYSDVEGRRSLIIAENTEAFIGSVVFSLNASEPDSNTIRISSVGDSLFFIAPFPVTLTNMTDSQIKMLEKNTLHRFYPLQLYSFDKMSVVLNKFYNKGRITARAATPEEGLSMDAIEMELTSSDESRVFYLWGKTGSESKSVIFNLENIHFSIAYGSANKSLSFQLKLNDFIIKRYPGSESPSWFESRVVLTDNRRGINEPRRIYMNNILKYKGYRFYQSSYDPDEKGTVLSVNHDWIGTLITYAGYLLMTIGMILSLANPKSRFQSLSHEIAKVKILKRGLLPLAFLLFAQDIVYAQDPVPSEKIQPVDKAHARLFGRLLVQDNGGRIEPVNTLSSEILRKLYRKNSYKGMNPEQVFLGMMIDPLTWQDEPIIRTPNPQIQEILGSDDKYFSFKSFFKGNNYVLHEYVERAFRKKPSYRSKFDSEIIRLDERINICYLVFTGELLRILPKPGDSAQTWFNFKGIKRQIKSEDSTFIENIIPMYLQEVGQSLETGDWKSSNDIIMAVSNYQSKYSKDIIPVQGKITMEIFMNNADVFTRISKLYGVIGVILLILQFIGMFNSRIKLKVPVTIFIILIITIFISHTLGLGIRWYVSGHAPWSNGYETLTYVAWATVLAGLIFSSRSSITLSATAILAFFVLQTAHLNWMDPQITNLVPVLKSYWLVIHVAVVTASYGFLALGALLATINLLLMIMQTRKNMAFIHLTIRELSMIIEMTLIVGLYLLTIGAFMGGVWANESWGRYWGWDPKETWALVSILVYAFILHMRMVPGLKGLYGFNLASLLGFSSLIMTYFGVNYYLSGLHSYAKGDPLPVPDFIYYSLFVIFIIALFAYINYKKRNAELERKDKLSTT